MDLNIKGKLTELPEGREVFVFLQDENLVGIHLTGGIENVYVVISIEQLTAIVESATLLLEEKDGFTKQRKALVEGRD